MKEIEMKRIRRNMLHITLAVKEFM